MARIFRYEDWASQDAPTSAPTPQNDSTTFWHDDGDSRLLKPDTFRQRLQSLPLGRKENETSRPQGDAGTHLAPDDAKRSGGFKGLLRKASVSLKNRQRRFSQMAPVAGEERAQPESPWHRLRTATSFHRHSRALSLNPAVHTLSDTNDDEVYAPVPGTGSRPPKIPRNGGHAARQNAARHNESTNPYLISSNASAEGDRESAIAMPLDNSDSGQSQDQDQDQDQTAVQAVSQSPVVVVASSTKYRDFIADLPNELAGQILGHVDMRTLRYLPLVSRGWLVVASDRAVWKEVFLREESQAYATGRPIPLGAGLGLPAPRPDTDWVALSKARQQLRYNWTSGVCQAVYLNGHRDSIYCVQFDEKKIITGSRDKTIRIWDIETHACTLVIGPPSVIDDISLMTDENNLPTHYAARLQDVRGESTSNPLIRGQESMPMAKHFHTHHDQSILCLQYDDEILVTGSSDSTCIVYDVKNGYKPIRQLIKHTAAVLDLAFDDKYIVTCSKDVSICVWDRKTGAFLKQLTGHAGPVNAVQLRGNTIVSCSGDFSVKMWNIETGNVIQTLRAHTKGLACSQFSEDSKYIASAGNDKLINLWDANTQQVVYTIQDAHENLVRSLHIDSVNGRLISGSYDASIKVFDMARGQETLHFPRWHASWVLGAKSDYRRIISTGQDPKILILDFGKDIKDINDLKS